MTKDLQFHAIDLIQTVCSTSRDYAGQILRRIVAAKQFFESDITYVVSGVRKMPLVSFHQAIKLLMVLPGVKANDGRGKFAQVVHAFIAGDPELKTKIDENAESLHWFNVLARESLQSDRAAASNRRECRITALFQRFGSRIAPVRPSGCRQSAERSPSGSPLRTRQHSPSTGLTCPSHPSAVTRQSSPGTRHHSPVSGPSRLIPHLSPSPLTPLPTSITPHPSTGLSSVSRH
jgi:hypothetical protein